MRSLYGVWNMGRKEVFMDMEVNLDQFCTWLCQHEYEVVGDGGLWFSSPLARWLSEQTGHVYGIDGSRYGRASWAFSQWRLLPRWAMIFVSWVDGHVMRSLTGAEALTILAQVELMLSQDMR